MTAPAEPLDLPFKYVGGDPSLDLVNTVDWLTSGLANERLTSYERLTRWAEGAGVISRAAAARLRLEAATRRREAEKARVAAVRLRRALHRLFEALARGEPSAPALARFAPSLAQALRRLDLAPAEGRRRSAARLEWQWREADHRLDSLLWPVAWSAATLLTTDEARRIRVCGGENCGWLYVDRSRNGLRRWCEMATCGTREKTRRRAERVHRRRPSAATRIQPR